MPAAAPQFAIEIARIAHDYKCEDVVVLDLRGLSPVMDLTVITTGTSDRQMRAVVDEIRRYARRWGQDAYGLAGYDTATWIVIDYVDVVFHVFARSHREYYDLELLWGDAPRIQWARSETG